MNKRDSKYFKLLSCLACSVEPVRKARMAACLVRRNEVIAFGTNQLKSHPIQARFSKNVNSIFLHAEIDCIKNALRVVDLEELRRCTLYVCRLKYESTNRRNFVYGLARPCEGCSRAISSFGIKNVIYSEDEFA